MLQGCGWRGWIDLHHRCRRSVCRARPPDARFDAGGRPAWRPVPRPRNRSPGPAVPGFGSTGPRRPLPAQHGASHRGVGPQTDTGLREGGRWGIASAAECTLRNQSLTAPGIFPASSSSLSRSFCITAAGACPRSRSFSAVAGALRVAAQAFHLHAPALELGVLLDQPGQADRHLHLAHRPFYGCPQRADRTGFIQAVVWQVPEPVPAADGPGCRPRCDVCVP
jgi:hypothetical protein